MANKVAMDAMMECMNAILGGSSGRTNKWNKENAPPAATNANRGGDKKAKKANCKKKLCPHCNISVFDTPDRCYGLDANKDNQWVGWKLVKKVSTWWRLGTTIVMVVADKLDHHPAYNHSNYWSPLACLVNEQEMEENSQPPPK
jgi:hypothetical protein